VSKLGVSEATRPQRADDVVGKAALPVTAVILTHNEEQNLQACLGSIAAWVDEMVVVDSGSTDATVEIARRYGARIVEHPFTTHAAQWAWVLESLPLRNDWLLGLDADQRVTPELRAELEALFEDGARKLAEVDGLYVKRRQIFRGRWIRHGGYYPKYLLKVVRRARARCDLGDLLDHHFYVEGRVLSLQHDLIEENRKEDDISFWIEKHNRYATLLAHEELRRNQRDHDRLRPSILGNPDERVLWRKRVWQKLPRYMRPFLYFCYRYALRLGFLDGKQGFVFHFLQAWWFRLLVDIKIEEEMRVRRGKPS
jgi:glycosyltransferase involved in cell wall biosynthesis